METLHILISGRVQGVGFRAFVVKKAKELNSISGWVRNRHSGGVEVLAEGNKEEIELLRHYCQKGPFFASVVKIEPAPFNGFVPPITPGVFEMQATY